MSKVSYYTAEGLKKLRDELQQLKDVERVKASKAIAEARDKGDLSENAEYDAAWFEFIVILTVCPPLIFLNLLSYLPKPYWFE